MTRWGAAVLLLTAAALAGQVHAHVDDTDAQLYTVVVRNMVRDGTWLDLSYLPNVHPKFREHLPFGFWPSAATVRVLGEGALPWLSALWTLVTVALVLELGRRLDGEVLGLLAGLILGTTEQFLFFGARHRLDPPLVFFALLAAAPLLVGKRGLGTLVLAAVAGAFACAIKGPFGAVPLVAAACARAVVDRDFRWLLWGALGTLLALLPVTLFLLVDRSRGGDWWSGYVEAQLFASATGARADGASGWWTPLAAVGSRFWPWLPLLIPGLWAAKANRNARLLAVWLAAGLIILLLPQRKWWHHVLVLFPALSLLAAVGVVDPVRRWWATPSTRARVRAALLAVAIGSLLVSWVALWPRGRAVACTDFQGAFAAQPKGTVVLVSSQAWREIATLASEHRLVPWMVDALPLAPGEGLEGSAHLALIADGVMPANAGPWRELGRARGWRLLQR